MDSLNTTVKSKNSHRNRLLMLLVDKQVEEEATSLVDTSHLMNTMMDEDDQFDDEYDDYEQIMKSNFSMCTSTFANFCDSSGSGAGPGGGGGGNQPFYFFIFIFYLLSLSINSFNGKKKQS